jgi:hypothetical protein
MVERTFRIRLTDIREEIAGIRALTKTPRLNHSLTVGR